MNEYSFGIIPLKKIENTWHVFLVKLFAGHWSFPKGHSNEGESEKETAIRELYEETHLVVDSFLPFEPLEEKYTYSNVNKTVTYFLATVIGDVFLQKDEIAEGRWVTLEEAHELITFDESRKLCDQVEKLIL